MGLNEHSTIFKWHFHMYFAAMACHRTDDKILPLPEPMMTSFTFNDTYVSPDPNCVQWSICTYLFCNIATKYILTHWGRVTHICVGNLTIIASDNGLSPGRRQAIIRTNAGILLIRPLGTNFSEFLVEILIFSFKKMRLKVSSAKRRPFCLGLNVSTERLTNRA